MLKPKATGSPMFRYRTRVPAASTRWASATTFRMAYDQLSRRGIHRHLWAFDSFRGLPEITSPLDQHPQWTKGSMSTDLATFHSICRSHGIPEGAYTAVPGFYEETLGSRSPQDAPGNIALAYIDCDLYSSTTTVLQFLLPRLKHGMIVAFDDYFLWSADQISGERRAMMEVLEGNEQWRFLPYRDYAWAGTSFVVERADPGAASPGSTRRS